MDVSVRYPILRALSIVLKLVSLLILAGTIYLLVRPEVVPPYPYGIPATSYDLVTLFGGLFLSAVVWGRAETYMVAIHTEENTRETAELLRLLVQQRALAPRSNPYPSAPAASRPMRPVQSPPEPTPVEQYIQRQPFVPR